MKLRYQKNVSSSPRFSILISTLTLCCFSIACAGPGQSVGPTPHPLVAEYTMESACAGQFMVEFGPDTSYGRSTSWTPTPGLYFPASIFVAGMRASTTYHMRSQTRCSDGVTNTGGDLTFHTGPLPHVPFPTLTVTRPTPSAATPENPGIEMMSPIDLKRILP